MDEANGSGRGAAASQLWHLQLPLLPLQVPSRCKNHQTCERSSPL